MSTSTLLPSADDVAACLTLRGAYLGLIPHFAKKDLIQRLIVSLEVDL